MSRINEILGSTQLSLLWICVIVAAMVFAALMYSTALFHRDEFASPNRNSGRMSKAAKELAWAIVPIFIIVISAAPAMRGAASVEHNRRLMTENRADACFVPVIGTAQISSQADCRKHR